MASRLPIQFTDPSQVLPGENCSKLLLPESPLVQAVQSLRSLLLEVLGDTLISPQRMPPHIEVISYLKDVPFGGLSAEEMTARAEALQGQMVEVMKLCVSGKALAFAAPSVPGYGPTHITVAHFRDGVPLDKVKAFIE